MNAASVSPFSLCHWPFQGLRRPLHVARHALAIASMCVLAGNAAAAPGDPCTDFVRWLPALSPQACSDAQLEAVAARSVRGQTLYRRNVTVPRPRLRVLVVGGMHGDEMSASSLVMHWIGLASADAADVSWRFIPVLNPDGMFRKTPQRTNDRGVDLNRNFPTPNWLHDSKVYWEQRTRKDPRRYPGPSPLSEPETRYLRDEMDRFQPNLIVSVHAPYGLLDFDGLRVEPPRRLGRLHLDQLGVFPGSLGNYGGVHRSMPVVTIELSSASETPSHADMGAMWTDLLAWMRAKLPDMTPPEPPIPAPVPSPFEPLPKPPVPKPAPSAMSQQAPFIAPMVPEPVQPLSAELAEPLWLRWQAPVDNTPGQ